MSSNTRGSTGSGSPNSDEDKLVQKMIEWKRGLSAENVRFYPEEHYNHYGDRGVVDLAVEDWEEPKFRGNSDLWVYEMKSESAIRNATGANEIIRQFKRHRNYFLKGSDFDPKDYYRVDFCLMFYATDYTFNHVKENEDLYRTLLEDGFESNVPYTDYHTHIVFHHPDAESLAHYFSDAWGYEVHSREILEILGRGDEFMSEEEFKEVIDL